MPADFPGLAAAQDALDALEAIVRRDVLAASPTRETDLALIATTREQLGRRYALAVLGEFSSGKSYLLNALLGKVHYNERGDVAGLLATDINPSTATITELEYGSPESAYARYASGREERIPLDRLSRFVAVGKNDERGALHDATADEESAPAFVVVAVDSPFLQSGFVVADTPGLASLNAAHRRATLAYLPRADAVLYLIDTQQPFTQGDASFLGTIGRHVRTIFIVQTKIDLWRTPEPDGREAWQAARERIVARAAAFAPDAEVFSVSAHEYALAQLTGDETLPEGSGFPTLLAGLERSLEARAGAARVSRTLGIVRSIATLTTARARRASELIAFDSAELSVQRESAEAELAQLERSLTHEREQLEAAGRVREGRIVAAGTELRERTSRALAAMIDVADIERIADRGKFGALVDATLGPIWSAFADAIAAEIAGELEPLARRRPDLRIVDILATRLGGEPGTGAWSRDLTRGIASTIVLGAIGGPAVFFVADVARGFAGRPYGTYMKRELGMDLTTMFLPQLDADAGAFVADMAARIRAAYDDAALYLERERLQARAEMLDPIERARAVAQDARARTDLAASLTSVVERLDALSERLDTFEQLAQPRTAAQVHSGAAQPAADATIAFDSDTYDRALRPERYRVVLLGALRRGKSSLINALAGRRLLQDDAAREALYPMHVRYGPADRAYALQPDGRWHEIATDEAVNSAAQTSILIEVPWRMPHELVIVHAPAFDSGTAHAESVALAAARNASEVLGLFSRQLSDHELALYERVAEFGKPMLLAHTFADNESASERRTVVELATRYVRERHIPAKRIFTISAVDYLDALQAGRTAAAWNELGALRETLHAHAEEHMRAAFERERRRREPAATAMVEPALGPNVLKKMRRLFGRR